MADDGKTPTRPIRIDLDLWDEYGELVGERNRSRDIREYIRWKLRKPGSKRPTQAPRRPE